MQDYKSHKRLLFTYHVLTGLTVTAFIIGTIRNFFRSGDHDLYDASLLVLAGLILLSIYIHARVFALKAQDRAIRAEEGLRYFILTGKPLPSGLTIQQVIALRFASDEELPALAQEALEKNLSNDAIKRQIRNWRPDTHRV